MYTANQFQTTVHFQSMITTKLKSRTNLSIKYQTMSIIYVMKKQQLGSYKINIEMFIKALSTQNKNNSATR